MGERNSTPLLPPSIPVWVLLAFWGNRYWEHDVPRFVVVVGLFHSEKVTLLDFVKMHLIVFVKFSKCFVIHFSIHQTVF